MKILVRAPNWIGDQILAYPFFYYLRRANPRAKIVVACLPWVESIQFRNLIDEVYVLPRPVGSGWRAKFAAIGMAARELHAEYGRFDLAYSLPNSFTAALLLFRAGAAQRVGYATELRGMLLTRRLPWKRGKLRHRSEAYVDLLESTEKLRIKDFWGEPPKSLINGEIDPADEGVPGVQRQFEPEKSWPDAMPLAPPEHPYWVLAPGSAAESRRWPAEKFAQVARKLLDETGLRGLIVGGPGEVEVAADLCSDRSLGLKDWTAQGSVASLWRVFRDAEQVVSNDSGLAHVAALCRHQRRLTTVVWGAGDPKRTEPLSAGRVKILFNPIACWPCEKNLCRLAAGHRIECLRGIDSSEVLECFKKENSVARI